MTLPLAAAFLATLAPSPADPGAGETRDADLWWADVDRDGLDDLLVAGADGTARLLVNRGDGSFADATPEAGLTGIPGPRFAAWEDFDGDERLDLLVGTAWGETRLYRGQGGASFLEVTRAAGLESSAPVVAARWLDFDRDGRPDLELRTEAGTVLWRNEGGAFAGVSLGTLATSAIGSASGASPSPPENAEEEASFTGAAGAASSAWGGTRSAVPDATRLRTTDAVSGLPGGANGATTGLMAAPVCASSLRDESRPRKCLTASSTPMLGKLYPLSTDLFVDAASGFVGIGTSAPLLRLEVAGMAGVRNDLFLGGDVLMTDDLDSITFPATTAPNAPMIHMFASGVMNADRMVIAHSPGAPTYGLSYEDDDDRFVFQMDAADPTLAIDLGESVDVAVDMDFADDDDSITFPVATGTTEPMIHMFAGGTTNSPRMLFAHSPSFNTFGLRYDDLSNDDFRFQVDDATPVLTLDMQAGAVSVDSGPLSVVNPGLDRSLDVVGSSATLTLGQIANIERTSNNTLSNDVLQLRVTNNSSGTSQFFECETTNNTKFRVDVNGNVFADGAHTGPADFAEMLRVGTGAGSVAPGDLLVIDPAAPTTVRRSSGARSTLVAGVYSARPGFVGSEREWDLAALPGSPEAAAGERVALGLEDMARLHDEVPVAVVGIVPLKVSAENGPIQPGDLLVSSGTPGHAMRDEAPRPGTIVGKALGSLAAGTGEIRVLVTLQ